MAPLQMIGSAITPVSPSAPAGAFSAPPNSPAPAGAGMPTMGLGNIGSAAGSGWGTFGGDIINANNARAQKPGSWNGQVGMALSAASMANRFGAGIPGVAVASDVMGIYNGIQRGGVMGYGGAAVNAANLANMAGAGIPGIPFVSAALSTYNAVKNWQSGATGADALAGAEAGASWGTAVLPGIGTAVGAVIGGAVGAISSAFGGGRTSQEALGDRSLDAQTANMTNAQRMQIAMSMSPAQSFSTIQGYMNAHDNSPGHSEQIEQVFGKNGVSNMMGQMLPAVNAALLKNPQMRYLPPASLYSQVVVPWLKSKGATINPNTHDVKGNPEGQNLIDAITGFLGAWQGGMVNSQTPIGSGGQTMSIPSYAAGSMNG
jgi:hypothetical protein